ARPPPITHQCYVVAAPGHHTIADNPQHRVCTLRSGNSPLSHQDLTLMMCTAAAPPHLTLAPLVCLSHTHVQFSSQEEDDANTPKGDGGSHLSRDPVYGGRLRACGSTYQGTTPTGSDAPLQRCPRIRILARWHRAAGAGPREPGE